MNLGHRLPSPTSGVMTTVKAEILKSNLSQMTMLKTEVALVTYPALIILLPRLHLELLPNNAVKSLMQPLLY